MPDKDGPFDYALMEVVEGATSLRVPQSAHVRGPKAKEGVPFYNPVMRASRDVSVLLLADQVEQSGRAWKVCDAMSSLGARGLRLANEVPGVQVLLNDANPDCIELSRYNAANLGLANVEFRVGRLESLLATEAFDWVDLDPFGTPAGFLDVAMLGVRDDGVLAVTATDKASLSGVYPLACQRRYNATPRRGECMPELALRILMGAVARAAGRRDRAIEPLLSYSTQHYVRTYVRVHGGATESDQMAKALGFAAFRPDGRRDIVADPPPRGEGAGPLWTRALFQPGLVGRLERRAESATGLAPTTGRLLRKWREEEDLPPLYYTIDEFTRGVQVEAPRLVTWLERLRAAGFVAARTHFDPYGIKTTAPPSEIRRALRASSGATA